MLELSEYEELRLAPSRPHVMYQRWRSLLFLHYSCGPDEVQRLLPPGLTVDTFNGRAWVGVVPFRMEGIRSRFVPCVPGTHSFPETNVRTYVHRDGKRPGVWFFSLDAANVLACRTARRFFHLPYHEAEMTVEDSTNDLVYRCRRRSEGSQNLVRATVGNDRAIAQPGSLDFFLVERYLLYAKAGRTLKTGRVHHAPYSLKDAEILQFKDELSSASGLTPQPLEHVCFSPGVDVRIYGLSA